MVRIKKVKYKLKFLEQIIFKEEPEIAFLKSIFKRLKNILCIKIDKKCNSCNHNSKCLYYYMSSGDFKYIETMPIIVERPLFSKRNFKAEDQLELKFIFLGEAAKHIEFIEYILKEFEARGLFGEKYRFVILNRSVEQVGKLKNNKNIKTIQVLTPIDIRENIFIKEKEKLDKLNELYNITDKTIKPINNLYEFDAVKFEIRSPLHLGANRFIQEGYIGRIKFKEILMESKLIDIIEIIGAGKYYAIGGGVIKIIN